MQPAAASADLCRDLSRGSRRQGRRARLHPVPEQPAVGGQHPLLHRGLQGCWRRCIGGADRPLRCCRRQRRGCPASRPAGGRKADRRLPPRRRAGKAANLDRGGTRASAMIAGGGDCRRPWHGRQADCGTPSEVRFRQFPTGDGLSRQSAARARHSDSAALRQRSQAALRVVVRTIAKASAESRPPLIVPKAWRRLIAARRVTRNCLWYIACSFHGLSNHLFNTRYRLSRGASRYRGRTSGEACV